MFSKTSLFLVLSFLFLLASFFSKSWFLGPKSFIDNKGYKNVLLDGNSFSPDYTGQIQTFKKDTLYCVSSFLNGKLHGKRTYFYPNGLVQATFNYSHNLLHDTAYYYDIYRILTIRKVYSHHKLIAVSYINSLNDEVIQLQYHHNIPSICGNYFSTEIGHVSLFQDSCSIDSVKFPVQLFLPLNIKIGEMYYDIKRLNSKLLILYNQKENKYINLIKEN